MKLKKFLPLLLISGSLFSCNNENAKNVYITFGKLYDSSLASDTKSLYLHTTNISYEDLNRKVKNQDNFVLLIYEYKTLEKGEDIECLCYTSLAYNLNIYIRDNNAEIYGIDPSDLKDVKDIFSLDIVAGEQTLAVFKDGNIHKQETTANNALSTSEKISSFFKDVIFSKMLYVSKSQLDSMFVKESTFTVGYLRKTCSDCAFLVNDFLKEYNQSSFDKNIYVIDCDVDGIRYNNDELDQEQWQSFKDVYGLSNKYNAEFGYNTGYIPTFLNYKVTLDKEYFGAYVVDGVVAYNDILTIDNGVCKISDTYWKGKEHPFFSILDSNVKTNLLNLEISKDEYSNYGEDGIYWKKDYAKEYHNKLIKGFLDYYTKN